MDSTPPVEEDAVPTEFDTARARLRKNVQIRCQGYENEKRRALFKRYLYISGGPEKTGTLFT